MNEALTKRNVLENVDLNKSQEGGPTITAKELEDLRKAKQEFEDFKLAQAEKDSEIEDLKKSQAEKDAQLEDFRKQKEDSDKAVLADFAKSLTFVEEDGREDLGVVLFKASKADSEVGKSLLAVLKKAQDTIEEFATAENGSDAESEEDLNKGLENDVTTLATEFMKSKKQG